MSKWLADTGYSIKGKWTNYPEYSQWLAMLSRCKPKAHETLIPTYLNCVCDPNWLDYDLYLKWAKSQVGFLNSENNGRIWSLDKDYLGTGKSYSPDCCVFIPHELNCFLTSSFATRSKHGVGISLRDKTGKYEVSCNDGNRKVFLGVYTDLTLAKDSYLTRKKIIAQRLALKYTGLIDARVILKLNNFTLGDIK